MRKLPLLFMMILFHLYLFVAILAKRREKIVSMFETDVFIEQQSEEVKIFFWFLALFVTYCPRNLAAGSVLISLSYKTGLIDFCRRQLNPTSQIDRKIISILDHLVNYCEKYYLEIIIVVIHLCTIEPSLHFEKAYRYFADWVLIERRNATLEPPSDFFVPYSCYEFILSSYLICFFFAIYILSKFYELHNIKYDVVAICFNILCFIGFTLAVYGVSFVLTVTSYWDLQLLMCYTLILVVIGLAVLARLHSLESRVFLIGCSMFVASLIIQEVHRHLHSPNYEFRLVSSAHIILLAYITRYMSMEHMYGFPLKSSVNRQMLPYGFDNITCHTIISGHMLITSYKAYWGETLLPYVDCLIVIPMACCLYTIPECSLGNRICSFVFGDDEVMLKTTKERFKRNSVYWHLLLSWTLFLGYMILIVKNGSHWNFVLLDVFAIEIGIMTLDMCYTSSEHGPTAPQAFSVWNEILTLSDCIAGIFRADTSNADDMHNASNEINGGLKHVTNVYNVHDIEGSVQIGNDNNIHIDQHTTDREDVKIITETFLED